MEAAAVNIELRETVTESPAGYEPIDTNEEEVGLVLEERSIPEVDTALEKPKESVASTKRQRLQRKTIRRKGLQVDRSTKKRKTK